MTGLLFGAAFRRIVLAISAAAMMAVGGGVVVARQAVPAVAETYHSLGTSLSVPAEATAERDPGNEIPKAGTSTTLPASTPTTSRVVATTNRPVTTFPTPVAPRPVSPEPLAPSVVAVATTVPKPVIIYLHAYGESPAAHLYRQDIIDALRAYATVLTPELCGATSGATDCAVEEAHRLKLQHSPNRPVKVLALSLGGITLGNWKAAYPNDVGVAVGLIPATSTVATDAMKLLATPDQSPPVPWGMSRFVCWYSPEDDIVGIPVPGSCTERHAIAGGHSALLGFPVSAIIDVLR